MYSQKYMTQKQNQNNSFSVVKEIAYDDADDLLLGLKRIAEKGLTIEVVTIKNYYGFPEIRISGQKDEVEEWLLSDYYFGDIEKMRYETPELSDNVNKIKSNLEGIVEDATDLIMNPSTFRSDKEYVYSCLKRINKGIFRIESLLEDPPIQSENYDDN